MTALVRAAGFIIFRQLPERVEYLLMQTSYGDHHWTPPKGHVDEGETDWIAAVRETKEEAGIELDHLEVIKDFKVELKYEAKRREGPQSKIVTYWLAKLVRPEQNVLLSDEHQGFRWLGLEEACTLAKYQDMQNALRDCQRKLEQN